MRALLILTLSVVALAVEDGFWHQVPRTIQEILAPTAWKAETKNDSLTLDVPNQGKIFFTVETKVQATADLETVARAHLTRWNSRSDKYTFKDIEGVAAGKGGKIRGYKVTVEVKEVESAPYTAYSYVFPGLLPGDYLWIWNPQGIENEQVDKMVRTLRRRN